MRCNQQDIANNIMSVASGFKSSLVLLVANYLGIFEALGREPMTSAALARRLKLNKEATELLLNALAGEGWLRKRKDRFSTPRAIRRYLCKDGSQYIGDILRHNYHLINSWIRLELIVREGRRRHTPKANTKEPQIVDAFIRGMANVSRMEIADVLKVVDPRNYKRMIDLGGGPGIAAIEFCRRNPQLSAVVFDYPAVLPIAQEEIEKARLSKRISTVAGDFMEDIPLRGFDLVYLSNIIHAYSLKQNTLIFRRCYKTLVAGGTIAVKDFFLNPDKTTPAGNSLFAINMLVNTPGGRTFTADEIKSALKSTGFKNPRFTWLNPRSALLLAKKPKKHNSA
ncbi:methyltransferase domain-containing protein [Candidatus Sumerlaeota bacterium]|nr:methyltransferase domain-containing protein [Candidatus Sumerlaeota bacterium]